MIGCAAVLLWVGLSLAGLKANARWDARRKRRPKSYCERWAVLATRGVRKF